MALDVKTTEVVLYTAVDDVDELLSNPESMPIQLKESGTPLAMVPMGLGLLVYIDPTGSGRGIITDIRRGKPVGYELVTTIVTLALWRPKTVEGEE